MYNDLDEYFVRRKITFHVNACLKYINLKLDNTFREELLKLTFLP